MTVENGVIGETHISWSNLFAKLSVEKKKTLIINAGFRVVKFFDALEASVIFSDL